MTRRTGGGGPTGAPDLSADVQAKIDDLIALDPRAFLTWFAGSDYIADSDDAELFYCAAEQRLAIRDEDDVWYECSGCGAALCADCSADGSSVSSCRRRSVPTCPGCLAAAPDQPRHFTK